VFLAPDGRISCATPSNYPLIVAVFPEVAPIPFADLIHIVRTNMLNCSKVGGNARSMALELQHSG
jgi:hypothetical protein